MSNFVCWNCYIHIRNSRWTLNLTEMWTVTFIWFDSLAPVVLRGEVWAGSCLSELLQTNLTSLPLKIISLSRDINYLGRLYEALNLLSSYRRLFGRQSETLDPLSKSKIQLTESQNLNILPAMSWSSPIWEIMVRWHQTLTHSDLPELLPVQEPVLVQVKLVESHFHPVSQL